MTLVYGLEAAPVNLSPRQAREAGLLTLGTCGPRGAGSSASAALQLSLESRLMQRFDTAGSILFSLAWKRAATPSGRPYYRLQASARRTSGTVHGSWPSPKASNTTGAGTRGEGGENLQTMASWATPNGEDAKAGASQVPGRKQVSLPMQTHRVASWSTPRANKWGFPDAHGSHEAPIGPTPSGSPAQTEKPGQLNPAFSLWLMGYPIEWARCAVQVTRSSLRLQQSLSRPISNVGRVDIKDL